LDAPIQECTQSHPTENGRLALVAPGGSWTRIRLDDEEEILLKETLPLVFSSDLVKSTNFVVVHPVTGFDALDPDLRR
jgi:hypothetical protein